MSTENANETIQESTSQFSSKEKEDSDDSDEWVDPMREPGAPYPPDTDSDEEEDIEMPKWMGPVKLDFPKKTLVRAYQFFTYERSKKLYKMRRKNPVTFVWPDLMQEYVDLSKEDKQPYVDEYREMKQSFRDQWEMEKKEELEDKKLYDQWEMQKKMELEGNELYDSKSDTSDDSSFTKELYNLKDEDDL